jgi:hypothetical protein
MKRFQATFTFFVLLLKNHGVEDCMHVIELWDISSAGNDVKVRILRESRQINTFVVINPNGTQILALGDSDSHGIFVQHILDKLCPRQANFWIVIFKITLYLAGLVMEVQGYQVIYCTQHIKFQICRVSQNSRIKLKLYIP